MSQLMPLPLTVSCFSRIQIGFTFLVLAHLGSPGNGGVCVCVLFVRPDPSAADSSPPGVSRFEIHSIGQFSDHQSQVNA